MTYLRYTLQQLRKKRVVSFSVGTLVTYVMSVSEWNFIALTSYTLTPTLYSTKSFFPQKMNLQATQRETVQFLLVQWNKGDQKQEFSEPCSVVTDYFILMDIFHCLKYTLHANFFRRLCLYPNVKVDPIRKPRFRFVTLHVTKDGRAWDDPSDSGYVWRGGVVFNKGGGGWSLLFVGQAALLLLHRLKT
jgi:hypothetical protein